MSVLIQKAQVIIGVSSSTATYTLPTPVTRTNAWILATWEINGGASKQDEYGTINWQLNSTGEQVTFTRGGSDGVYAVTIEMTCIEDTDVTVYRGSGTAADDTGTSHSIGATVSTEESFPLVCAYCTDISWNFGSNTALRIQMSTTQVTVYGNANNTANSYYWQVITASKFSVQPVNKTLPDAITSVTQSITTVSDTTKTAVFGSASYDDWPTPENNAIFRLSSDSQLTFERFGRYLAWEFDVYVVECNEWFVQRNSINIASASVTDYETLSTSIDEDYSFINCTSGNNRTTGYSNLSINESSYIACRSWFSNSGSRVNAEKAMTGAEVNYYFEAIEFTSSFIIIRNIERGIEIALDRGVDL